MKTLLATLIVLLIAPGFVSAADDVLLFQFKGIGVDYDLVEAVTSIFHGALAEEGVYQPVFAAEILGDVDCHDVSCAVELAREAGIGKAVTGNVTRLGNKIIVRVQLIDADKEKIEYSDDGVSQTEEDLDVVLSRLAKSLSTGRKMEDTAEVGLITEKETQHELEISLSQGTKPKRTQAIDYEELLNLNFKVVDPLNLIGKDGESE